MNRREFISFAATGVAVVPHTEKLEFGSIIKNIEAAIKDEFPDAKLIQVKYDPEDARMPLAIQVFRI